MSHSEEEQVVAFSALVLVPCACVGGGREQGTAQEGAKLLLPWTL